MSSRYQEVLEHPGKRCLNDSNEIPFLEYEEKILLKEFSFKNAEMPILFYIIPIVEISRSHY